MNFYLLLMKEIGRIFLEKKMVAQFEKHGLVKNSFKILQ